ncbi:uncharacterized protein [Cicer arietinum]|uniref:uncharacterized protein n=1 Tax=Cicer arietinum TaxID=3827 RepID=UPI003CC6024D
MILKVIHGKQYHIKYGGHGDESVFEQLSLLKQEGSVEVYNKEFERLVAQVDRLPEGLFVGYFIHGLCDGIRGRVCSLNTLGSVSRAKLMNLARVVEAEVQEKRIGWNGPHDYGPKGSDLIDNPSPRELQNVCTIKLKSQVQGVPLLALVDSGATHNFISNKLVRSMGWPLEETTPLPIKLGDMFNVVEQGVCRKLVKDLGNMTFIIDAWLFDLDEINVVIEMSWLASIGDMWVD